MALGETGRMGAQDVDFFAYKAGIYKAPGTQLKAWKPNPEDGSRAEPTNTEPSVYMLMTFNPGDTATEHTAYFSEDFDLVNDRDDSVKLGSPPHPRYYPTGYYVGLDDANVPEFAREPLEKGKTYYWVVDESNGVETYPGDVWSFSVATQAAWNPSPADGAKGVNGDPDVDLSWNMGDLDPVEFDISYDVYYGTDAAAVEASTTPNAHVTNPTATIIGPLLGETDYYWRVDTVAMEESPPSFPTTTYKGDVWQFTTMVIFPITDESLIGHWTFDVSTDDFVADTSGHSNHGTARVNATRVPGYEVNAMSFDGSSWVELPPTTAVSTSAGTVALWVRTSQTSYGHVYYGASETGGNGGGGQDELHLDMRDDDDAGRIRLFIEGGDNDVSVMGPVINNGEWHHVAATWDALDVKLYVGGDTPAVGTNTGNTYSFSVSHRLGRPYDDERYFVGDLDDVRLYNRALSQTEIKQILRGGDLARAYGPNPPNGAIGVERSPVLTWNPGDYAPATNGHYVYFGTGSVDNMVLVSSPAQPQTATSYSPGLLDFGTSCYWKVSEANSAALPDGMDEGATWSFTTIDHIMVDTMETYTHWTIADNNIFEVYVDGMGNCKGSGNGTGANVFESPGNGVGGSQAMEFNYDNDGMVLNPCLENPVDQARDLYYSKAEAEIGNLPSGIGSDWTAGGTKALVIPFFGQQANQPETMWVELGDGVGNKAKVTYGDYDDEDPNDILEESWHYWMIDLGDFTGVDASNVKSIAIGFGTEGATAAGGWGKVYFDEIALYAPRCILSRRSADFAKFDYAPESSGGDCLVNGLEVDVMMRDWLLTDAVVDGELLVQWAFDEGSGLVANDSSGKGHSGVIDGAFWVEDFERGWCLSFAQGSGATVLDNDANSYLNGLRSITVSAWIKSTQTPSDSGFIIFHEPSDNDTRDIRYDSTGAGGGETNVIKCGVYTDDGSGQESQEYESASGVQTALWQHVALVWSSGTDLKLYIDGVLDEPSDLQATRGGTTVGYDLLMVGKGGKDQDPTSGWAGLIDDVRVYNFALTDAEVMTVKNGGAVPPRQVHYPPQSPAELYEGEPEGERVINFKDYAELADKMLDEELWPSE